jgi:hypothetical protein
VSQQEDLSDADVCASNHLRMLVRFGRVVGAETAGPGVAEIASLRIGCPSPAASAERSAERTVSARGMYGTKEL